MEICYIRKGNYLLPNLVLNERKKVTLGKYAKMRLKYIKEEMNTFYQTLLMTDELTDYLLNIDAEAKEMELNIITSMKKNLNVNEELKSKAQMQWVQMMNNISNSAQEIVLSKLIYYTKITY